MESTLERRILNTRPKSKMLGLDLLSQIGQNQLDFYTWHGVVRQT